MLLHKKNMCARTCSLWVKKLPGKPFPQLRSRHAVGRLEGESSLLESTLCEGELDVVGLQQLGAALSPAWRRCVREG